MFSDQKTLKWAVGIFCAALAMRIIFLSFFYPAYEARLLEGDSIDYITLARNILTHKSFSLDAALPLRPALSYTPGYPLFLIGASAGTLNLPLILIAQNVVAALGAVLIFLLGLKILNHLKAAALGAAFYIFEPGTVFFTNQILTEALFLVCFLAGLLFFLRWLDSRSSANAALLALFLGLATYVRPNGQFILIILLAFMATRLWQTRELFSKKAVISLFLPLFIFALVLTPWIIRNKNVTGHRFFSTFGPYALATRFLPSYFAWEENIPMKAAAEKTKALLMERGIPAEAFDYEINYDPKLQGATLKIMAEHPYRYFLSQLRFIPSFFLSSGWGEIIKIFQGNDSNPPYFPGGLTKEALEQIKKQGGSSALIGSAAGAAFFGLVYIFALFGLGRVFLQMDKKIIAVFTVVLIAYFFFSTGELSYSRYRYPVNPIIFTFATAGFMAFWNRLHSREAPIPARLS